jgi:hypothetical protein
LFLEQEEKKMHFILTVKRGLVLSVSKVNEPEKWLHGLAYILPEKIW